MTVTRAAAPRRDQRGQATVELALLLPFVCALVLLVVQVALVARDQLLLATATREAARVAAVDGDPAAARAAGQRATDLDPRRLFLTVEGPDDHGLLAVHARYRVPVVVPLLAWLRPEVDLAADLVVRGEVG